MMRHLSIIACLFCSTALQSAFAQDKIGETTFKGMQLARSGEFEINIDGPVPQVVRMYKGVHLTLIAETADENLDIEAWTVDFTYDSEEDKMPSVIVFSGAVRFTHASGTIRAEKATIYVAKKEVLFTGNPKADLAQVRGIEAESIHMNLGTGIVNLHNASAREFLWGDDAEASDAAKPRDRG